MEKVNIKQKIIEYFSENYKDRADMGQLPMNGGLMAYLGVDSMHSLEILIDMETLFGIEITDELLNFKLVDNIEHMSETFGNLVKLSQGR